MKTTELTVWLTSFPESNGKRNWTAMFVRNEKWDGLAGNCGGITISHGEYWNRVAYEAERARFLLGERDTEPHILDFGDDIETPEEWKGEVYGGRLPRSRTSTHTLDRDGLLGKAGTVVKVDRPELPDPPVYAELPTPTVSFGEEDAWTELQMQLFADRTHELRIKLAKGIEK